MSRLDKLIQELCPCGIETISICDIADYEQPTKYIVESTDYNDAFETPVLTAGQTFILGYTNETNGIYEASKDYPVIIFDDFTGAFKWVDFPFKIKSSAIKIITAKDNVSIRYLYHLMGFLNYTSTEHKRLWISIYSKFEVALPPMEVQQEIVRLLDGFTVKTAELQDKLNEELEARKKQYEYYRDDLLKPQKSIPMVTLKEISTSIYRGTGIKRDQITEDGIPCVRYGEIYTTYDTSFDECVSHTKEEYITNPKYFEHGDILFAITGESVEDIAKSIAYVGHDKCLAGGDIVVMKHHQNPRYLAHVLNTSFARKQKSKGKIKSKVVHSNVPSIEQIRIPLPSLEVQKRYADVLDNFEQICKDLNICLPVEIEVRQKYYEYYRDMLLTYAETGSIMPQTDRQIDRQTIIKLIRYVFGFIMLPLSEVCYSISSGKAKTKDAVGEYPVYGSTGIIARTDQAIYNKTNILVARVGANAGYTHLAHGSYDVSDNTLIVDVKNDYNLKYVYYQLVNIGLNRYAKGGGQPLVTAGQIKEVVIPVPMMQEQKHIVTILDSFDILCNDLTSCLLSEIEVRQKQYEYYRDMLLTFKVLK